MKKQFLNLGKALNKAEQKEVNGGRGKLPELCEIVDGVVYVCYPPMHCSMEFPYTCVE